MSLLTLDSATCFGFAIVASLFWISCITIFRFFFHPLSGFPGPKLAIASYAYELYYDLYMTGLTFKLEELHKRYGPVVRINPNDLHIANPHYFDEVFDATNGKADKPLRSAKAFGPYPAAIGTADHDLHRIRRSALNPFFSKRSVTDLVPSITSLVNRLCDRLRDANKTGQPVNLKYCFAALTLDIINEYCFSTDPETTLKADFGEKEFDDIDSFLKMSLWNIHIPWLMEFTYSLPESIVKNIKPAARDIYIYREQLSRQIESIRNEKGLSYTVSGHRTIFHDLLKSNLPARELGRDRLRDEAFTLVAAGSGTTAFVMKCLSYHVAANPHVQAKLLQDLKTVMPHPDSTAELRKLESLQYLTAVLQEGLRLAVPVSHRIVRIFQKKTLIYDGKVIPPGTAVGMTPFLIHQDEDIFSEPHMFRPERWLGDENLHRYLLAFSRGPRSCTGINLAWAELYLVIAKIFRQFNFDISGVVRERDIDIARDVLLGVPRADSHGVHVKICIVED